MKFFKLTWYLKSFGTFASYIGLIDNYSEEHKEFLKNGFKCQKCNHVLMKSYGVADVNCYDMKNIKVPTFMIGLKGKYFECSKCKYQWKFRNTDSKLGIILITLVLIIILASKIFKILA